jgi:hypothetical protein
MSSTCFEPEGSSSGRLLYVQLWYGTFYMRGPGSSVGIANDYGLGGPGIDRKSRRYNGLLPALLDTREGRR